LVATQWVFRGTNTGTLTDGTAATGRTVTQPGATFYQFEGDKIRSERAYVDMHDTLKQLGLKAK
jgi:predicted ester cyclase